MCDSTAPARARAASNRGLLAAAFPMTPSDAISSFSELERRLAARGAAAPEAAEALGGYIGMLVEAPIDEGHTINKPRPSFVHMANPYTGTKRPCVMTARPSCRRRGGSSRRSGSAARPRPFWGPSRWPRRRRRRPPSSASELTAPCSDLPGFRPAAFQQTGHEGYRCGYPARTARRGRIPDLREF